ncbi:MAG: hypothetical protein Q4F10_02775 [Corynebacterium glutamicum]|nr:hypothetical protein [Corynebacterium glutamicum]
MTDLLTLQELCEAIGCKPNRVVFLHRCGLLDPWSRFIKYDEYQPHHTTTELVEVSHLGIDRVRFSPEILTDPRVFILLLNQVDPAKFGPGWEGVRDMRLRLPGVLDRPRIRALEPGQKIPAVMRRIARMPLPPRTGITRMGSSERAVRR